MANAPAAELRVLVALDAAVDVGCFPPRGGGRALDAAIAGRRAGGGRSGAMNKGNVLISDSEIGDEEV